MKKYTVYFQIILLLILAVSFPQLSLGSEYETSNVLVIYSHHFNFEWVEHLQKGINDALEGENLYFYNEYLNEHQLSNDTSYEDLFNAMYVKYKNVDFDCVVVADNYAYNFMAEYYEALVPNTPVVFVGVNGYSEDIAFTDNMTGIVQNSDLDGIVDLILSINNQDELIFVSSQNATSIAEISAAEKIIKKDYPNLNYRIVVGKTLDEELDQLKGVENAQLIMIGNNITSSGTILSPEELIARVYETTHLPIYTGNRLQIGEGKTGAVGGVVVDPYVHAFEAGLMVKKILNGVDVHTIPVRIEPLTTYVFNYNMLEHFNIDEKLIPSNSIILGRSDNNIIIGKGTAASIGIITVLLLLFLVVLLLKSRELKQEIEEHTISQKKLRESNDKFKAYIGMSPLGIFVANRDGRFIEVNKKACELTGYTEERLLTMSISDYLIKEEIGPYPAV